MILVILNRHQNVPEITEGPNLIVTKPNGYISISVEKLFTALSRTKMIEDVYREFVARWETLNDNTRPTLPFIQSHRMSNVF